MKKITSKTKLRELLQYPFLDCSGIKPEYLDYTFGQLGDVSWKEADPSGKFVKSFNVMETRISKLEKNLSK